MPAATEPGPVTADAARRLFVILEPFDAALLAVSGGSDSMALMWLAARWARETGWSGQLYVAVVDHGLRPEAADEARFVMAEAEKLGFTARTLTWAGPHPTTGIPAAARDARYALLTGLAAKLKSVLVTAHTQDDQTETVLMRLARGSGVDGLSGMAVSSMRDDVELLRPLLGISREELRATLREAGVTWIDDPTNENTGYERVRVRRALDILAEVGVTREAVALSARRLGRARNALEVAVMELMQASVHIEHNSFATVSIEPWLRAPEELQVRSIMELARLFGSGQEISLLGAERVLEWFLAGQGKAITFGGCRFARRAKAIIVGREAARVKADVIPMKTAGPMIWDQRYEIEVPQQLVPTQILPVKACKGLNRPRDIPDFVWRGLPVIETAVGQMFTPVDGCGNGAGPVFRLIHAPNRLHDYE